MSTTVTRKGQVTIPKAVRERLGIEPGSQVAFELAPNGQVILINLGDTPAPFSFDRLRGVAGPGLTTDQIMAMTRGEE